MTASGTRRSQHKTRTRDALIAAAWTLFRAQGYEATTVDQIAAGAGVSRRTFFRYFANKDAVVFPHAEPRLAGFAALLVPRPGETPLRAVRRACLDMAAEFAEHREEQLLQAELVRAAPSLLARELELDRRWEGAVIAALEGSRGRGARGKRQARVLAGAVVGALRAVLRLWLEGGAHDDLEALAAEAFDLISGSLDELGGSPS